MEKTKHSWTQALNLTVLVAGLGYFVDMFDITIFGVVRVASLKALGLSSPQELLDAGIYIYNVGIYGLMLGGIIWGITGDKKGRLSVLFGSILLYSLGNIFNAFVKDIHGYALCRFISGIGLAGELGAAITLVSESLPKNLRGVGTTIVATLGLTGSVVASYVGQILDWKTSYLLGGGMGLALLATRFHMRESTLFMHSSTHHSKSSLFLLFKPKRFYKYFLCICLGVPIYFITGILFTFSPEITAAIGIDGQVTAGNALLFGTIGLTIGDLLSGLVSQILTSRKLAVACSLALATLCGSIYLLGHGLQPSAIYALCFLLGIAAGYWAVLVTIAAEQFGTNMRATVATTVPNFVRGSAALSMQGFLFFKSHFNVAHAALLVGMCCLTIAIAALVQLKETFGISLDFYEE